MRWFGLILLGVVAFSGSNQEISYESPKINPWDVKAPILWDEFATGAINSSGNIGQLGWTVAGTHGTAQVANRPGIATVTAGATAFADLHVPNAFVVAISNVSVVKGIAAWATGANQPDSRFGIVSTNTGAEPADDAVYFERNATEADWFAVTRDGAGANMTRTDTNVAFVAGNYYALEIRHPSSGQWNFYINDNLVASRSSGNIPAEATFIGPMFQIETNGTGLAMSVDYFFMQLATTR